MIDECSFFPDLKAWVTGVALITYLGLMAFTVILSIKFIKNRNMFPMKERSPILSVASLASYFLGNSRDTLMVCFVHHADERAARLALGMISAFGQLSFAMLYIFKVARIYYVIRATQPTRFWRKLFRNQIRLCKISFEVALMATVLFHLRMFQQLDNAELAWFIFKLVLMIVMTLIQVTFLVGAYTLTDLKTEYSIAQENVQLFIYMVFLSAILTFKDLYETDYCEVEWIVTGLTWTFYLVFAYISMIQPLRNSREYHKKQHSLKILDHFESFIRDEMCLESFKCFLEHKQLHNSAEGNSKLIDVLVFYFKVRIELNLNTNEITPQFAQDMAEYIRRSPSFVDFYQSCESVLDLQEVRVNEADVLTQRERNIGTVRFFFNQTLRCLEEIYMCEFSRTPAHEALREKLVLNERIDRNLMLLDMTIINPLE